MANALFLHLKPLYMMLNLFGFVKFKGNDENYEITYSNRYLNILKMSFNSFVTLSMVATIIKFSRVFFGEAKIILFLSVLYIYVHAFKITSTSFARYIWRKKYLTCWTDILENDEYFTNKIGAINYKVIRYPIVINIFHAILQNVLMVPSCQAIVMNDTIGLSVCWMRVIFEYQCMTLKMEYMISLLLMQNYLKQLERKLNKFNENEEFRRNSKTFIIKDINKFYFNVCGLFRKMLSTMWVTIYTLLIEAVCIITIQGYLILSMLYDNTNANVKYHSYTTTFLWLLDASVTIFIIIFPSYLCKGSVSTIIITHF